MNRPFHPETFELLNGLAQTPTAGYYRDHREAIRQYVERPLQGILLRAGTRLPAMMLERLETQRNLFSRILKNDFGRGGAWASYWGAFYPKHSRRLADIQLSLSISAQRLQMSFYIGDYAKIPRQRFLRNVARYRDYLPGLLPHLFHDPRILLSREGRTFVDDQDNLVPEFPMTWEEWLDDPKAADFWLRIALHPRRVTAMCADELETLVAEMHSLYFPLALLAMEEEPLPLIRAYEGLPD